MRASGQDVLAPATLRVAPGEHVALVGLSGAGKSTLLALALGLADPSEGRVSADGLALAAGGARALWPSVAWVDPQVRVWNRDLAHNLAPLADAERVGELVAAAELGDVAARVDGEPLGADGGLLSGGEAQRVRLARALGRDGVRLAILDEPLRGLDREQRHRLLAVARARWKDATLLCATHDVVEALSFDRVLVMEGGRIVADGPPDGAARRAGLAAAGDARHRARATPRARRRARLAAAARDGRRAARGAAVAKGAAGAADERRAPRSRRESAARRATRATAGGPPTPVAGRGRGPSRGRAALRCVRRRDGPALCRVRGVVVGDRRGDPRRSCGAA